MRLRWLYWGTLAVLLGVAGLGCGGSKNTVKVDGTLSWDNGEPISGATVTFVPVDKDGKQATGLTGKNGEFELTTVNSGDGAVPGEYNITVTKLSEVKVAAGGGGPPAGSDPMKAMKEQWEKKGGGTTAPSAPKSLLPEVYSKPGTPNPLKWKVESGSSKVELKLKKA